MGFLIFIKLLLYFEDFCEFNICFFFVIVFGIGIVFFFDDEGMFGVLLFVFVF